MRDRAKAVAAALGAGGLLWGAHRLAAHRSVDSVVRAKQGTVERALAGDMGGAGLSWPARRLAILAFKAERRLELWGGTDGVRWSLIKRYPILAASGGPGPKLREGDRQVPEGLYEVESLNPNSSFYLSLRVSYPNPEDRAFARAEGRRNPGGDIYIHGNAVSIGCLAIGDAAIEEVFVAAALARRPIPVLIAPRDFRLAGPTQRDAAAGPPWLMARYEAMTAVLRTFRSPAERAR